MSVPTSPDGRWTRARTALRLAGLIVVVFGIVQIPPGVGLHGRGAAVAAATVLAAIAWLVMIEPPHRPRVRLAASATQIVAGGLVTGLTPGGPAVALAGVGIFDAVVLFSPRVAARLTVAGAAAMVAAAVAAGSGWATTAAGYGFALAAALLLGFNRRQYLARTEQAEQLLAESRRARQEQARAAALEERTRIAREIHDLLAHSLGALAVQLDVADALIADGAEPARVRDRLQRARNLAVDGLDDARRAVAALRGETVPLHEQLGRLLEQYRRDTGIRATLEITGTERRLGPDADLAVLRAAQEGVSNARKHAPDAALAARLAYQDDTVTFTLKDRPGVASGPTVASPIAGPGSGAATGAPAIGRSTSMSTTLSTTGAGYGLTGLRERATLLGGTLDSGPDGTGWTLRLRLPCAP